MEIYNFNDTVENFNKMWKEKQLHVRVSQVQTSPCFVVPSTTFKSQTILRGKGTECPPNTPERYKVKGILRGGCVIQAYSRLSTTHGHITDCKLDSVVYSGVYVCHWHHQIPNFTEVRSKTSHIRAVGHTRRCGPNEPKLT